MPRTFAAVLPLAVLALLSPGRAVAGPPEGASGKMVLDEVANGLRKFRQVRTEAGRMALLKRLAPIQDPRVEVFLGEIVADDKSPLWFQATYLLNHHHIPGDWEGGGLKFTSRSRVWWKENQAELRRRARALP